MTRIITENMTNYAYFFRYVLAGVFFNGFFTVVADDLFFALHETVFFLNICTPVDYLMKGATGSQTSCRNEYIGISNIYVFLF